MSMNATTGRPLELDEYRKQKILAAIPEVIVQAQVAKRARIPKQTLNTWLVRGQKEKLLGLDTEYTRFSDEYDYAQSQVVCETLADLRKKPKSYGALVWILERCFKSDFGDDSDQIQYLMDIVYNQILPILGKGIHNGRKEIKTLDTEGNQASRGIAQGITCSLGTENPSVETYQGSEISEP